MLSARPPANLLFESAEFHSAVRHPVASGGWSQAFRLPFRSPSRALSIYTASSRPCHKRLRLLRPLGSYGIDRGRPWRMGGDFGLARARRAHRAGLHDSFSEFARSVLWRVHRLSGLS